MEITPEMQELFDEIDEQRQASYCDDCHIADLAYQLRDSFRPKCPITEEVTLYEDDIGVWWPPADWTADFTGRRIILQPAAEGEMTGIYRWEEG